MDVAGAFERLGLPSGASVEAILARHKELVPLAHHDSETGDGELMATINAARDVALAARTGTALVARAPAGELEAATHRALVRYQEAQTASAAVVRSMTRMHVSRLRDQRNGAATAAAVAGVAALVPQGIRLVVDLSGAKTATDFLTAYGFLIAAMFAVRAAVLGARARRNERAIEDIQDTLDDKGKFVSLLRELDMLRAGSSWAADEVKKRVDRWLPETEEDRAARRERLNPSERVLITMVGLGFRQDPSSGRDYSLKEAARLVGAEEFARLLLRKGIERDLFTEDEEWADGGLELTYKVRLGAA